MNRREFMRHTSLATLALYAPPIFRAPGRGIVVNDVHSELNLTRVDRVVSPESIAALREAVRQASRASEAISIAGGRHAMGCQQFVSGGTLIDTRHMSRVLSFDAERGMLEVEAGIEWPELIAHYLEAQKGRAQSWGIAQKQTGANRFAIGGTLSANAHGRGLAMRPIISDVESLTLVDARGELRLLSRSQEPELFKLAIGGYGLFGAIASVTLRLAPRRKIERVVRLETIENLAPSFDRRIADGFLYGDFQFSPDQTSDEFLRTGVFSCYRPVDPDRVIPENQRKLSEDDWRALLYLAHTDKREAFRRYAAHYLATNGQLYWSDTHQLATYLEGYHHELDRRLKSAAPASEIITEIYVPQAQLVGFMAEAAEDFRRHGVNLIYGTIQLIERDGESFLEWAKQRYACVIFNLHTVHTPEGIAHSRDAFCRLIDMAIARSGSYYLTFHKFAERQQVEACYPRFREFLRLKRKLDPDLRFQSNWWRHYSKMFGEM